MKNTMKKIYSFLVLLVTVSTLMAQSPKSFKYQAVVRDNNGVAITNKQVSIKISILQSSATGNAVYSETHKPTSGSTGLINLEIGKGSVVSGSMSTIDWSNGSYFVKVELDPAGGSSYSEIGTSQLLSVPYALYAEKAGNGFSGNYSDLSNKPNLNDTSKYLKTEQDPAFNASVAKGIVASDTAKWNAKSNFSVKYSDLNGKPNLADTSKYLKTETDPSFNSSIAKGINATDTTNWNAKSDFSGKYADLSNIPANIVNTTTAPSTGDMLFYNGVGWLSIPKGSNGQILTISDGKPQWQSMTMSTNSPYPIANMAIESLKIDGTGDDAIWNNLPFIDITEKCFLSVFVGSGVPQISAKFKMCYDSENIYFFVVVVDNTPFNNKTNFWDNDGVELYFHIDTFSKTDGSYTTGDYKISTVRGDSGLYGTFNEISSSNSAETDFLNNTNFKKVEISNSNGYTQEWQIPWSLLTHNLTFSTSVSSAPGTNWNGKNFGLDITVNDNADGLGRASQIGLESSGNAYQDTRVFKRIQLGTQLNK